MHQKTKLERFLADVLMAMAFYGHFRTEHVFVHHRYVGTKKDAVTARFNESFYTVSYTHLTLPTKRIV